MSSTKTARVVREFLDAGEERIFAKGEIVTLETGAFANYAAAGLVEETGAAPAPAPEPAPEHAADPDAA